MESREDEGSGAERNLNLECLQDSYGCCEGNWRRWGGVGRV